MLNDAPKVPLQVRLWFCPGELWKKADIAPDDVRVLKSSLRTSKYCLGKPALTLAVSCHLAYSISDHCYLSLAETVIERAAFYEEKLKSHKDISSQEHGHLVTRLSNEYLAVRIALVSRPNCSQQRAASVMTKLIGLASRSS